MIQTRPICNKKSMIFMPTMNHPSQAAGYQTEIIIASRGGELSPRPPEAD